MTSGLTAGTNDRYKWVALTNTASSPTRDTPWAGRTLLPLTAGFLVAGPTSGFLSDRFGSRGIATAGMAVFGGSFIGLMLLPVDFPYWAFALLIAANGIGGGRFSAPEYLLASGLQHQGVPRSVAHHIGILPPVSSLFAASRRCCAEAAMSTPRPRGGLARASR